jgi:hypothetical protein
MTVKELTLRLLALELGLLDVESGIQQVLLFFHVAALETSGDTGAGVSTSIENVSSVVVLGLIQQSLDTGLCEGPWTCIERLLLGPDNVLGVGVGVEVLLELSPGEGVELLNTGDGGVGDAVLLAVLVQSSVDLTGTKDDALNLLLGLDLVLAFSVGRVGDDPLEVRVASELLDGWAGQRVTEKRLWKEEDES